MKKVSLFLVFLIASAIQIFASHTVGGELEMIHKRAYVYQIILKLYVDEINANPTVIGSEIDAMVAIFEKGTNIEKKRVRLLRKQSFPVDYKQCGQTTSMLLKTRVLIFYADVQLDETYNRPEGYYISWQNCCRNITIRNINLPDREGMAFYLEFPPVSKNGVRFINSSPHFPQIVGDYPCVDRPFTMEFSGTDLDGDSLVYKTATPLAGFMADLSYRNQVDPGPYPTISWAPGYDVNNQIRGTPSFGINLHTGMIAFTSYLTGLFVFSVIVEEYRDGIKIGMVQRDFQLLVATCSPNSPNSVDLEFPDGSTYDTQMDTLKLHIERDTCFTINVSDQNTIDSINPKNENLTLTIIKNTLPPNIVTFSSRVTVSPGNDTASVSFCLDACNKLIITRDTTFELSMVVTDAPKCPKSLAYYDTLNLIIRYTPQINAMPTMGTIPNGLSPVYATVGRPIAFDVFGEDTDAGDIIHLTAVGEGFGLGEKGMLFNTVNGTDSIGSRFFWTPDCKNLEDERLKVMFIVKDNSCIPMNKDTITIEFIIKDTTTNLTALSPSNMFTPNGDGLNDYFSIANLAEGNCDYYFKKIMIFNRWGSKVYEHDKPDFKWSGEKNSSGLYFYTIDINKKEYKGWIEIIR